MITWEVFQHLSKDLLERNIFYDKNPQQNEAIKADINESLFVVAGPGSGKTTLIVLKILKHIFVDDIPPEHILVTTFTKKAASELKSRLLGWGDQIKVFLSDNCDLEDKLDKINLNEVVIGTLDSIAEDLLTENREPGNPPPAVIEDFVCNSLMRINGLFPKAKQENEDLIKYLTNLRGTKFGLDISEICSCLLDIKDRFFQDAVDIDAYRNSGSVPELICEAIDEYLNVLDENLFLDFSKLEKDFLLKIEEGIITKLENLKLILVDEYQDTNLLQEKIYFEIASIANKNEGSITIVGDDDQSLYRFRGATVDLFNNFIERLHDQKGINSKKIDLSKNYRSSNQIVTFCNSFIKLDDTFQDARVEEKNDIEFAKDNSIEYPILGIFREDKSSLTNDLADFIHEIVHGNGVSVTCSDGDDFLVKTNLEEGSASDIVFLCSSPADYSSSGNERLPLLLRNKLKSLDPPISVFNPRGKKLESVYEIQILCGLILECIDPESIIQDSIEKLPNQSKENFINWRVLANEFVNNHDDSKNLLEFINAWKNRKPTVKTKWDKETSLISLVYNLITWIPFMQNDVEGLVYLEVVSRAITQSSLFSNFGPKIIYDEENENLSNKSIEKAIWNIFVPLATGAIEINEDLLETISEGRMNVMSIHQAKGLEFPVTIVDVGSDFEKNLKAQRFKRFPDNPGKTCNLEDIISPFCELDPSSRSAIDRAFDDLIRQYFVAYSRPKELLLLVGLNSVRINYKLASGVRKEIPNIATGWDRRQEWKWKKLRNVKNLEPKHGTLNAW